MQFYVTQFSVQSIIKMEQDEDVVVKHKEFVDVKDNVDEEPNNQYFKQQARVISAAKQERPGNSCQNNIK